MQEETSTERSKSGWLPTWALIVASVIIFYVVSPGPVLFLLGKTGLTRHDIVMQCFTYFYLPHAFLAMTSDIYLAYVLWWFDVAGVPLF